MCLATFVELYLHSIDSFLHVLAALLVVVEPFQVERNFIINF